MCSETDKYEQKRWCLVLTYGDSGPINAQQSTCSFIPIYAQKGENMITCLRIYIYWLFHRMRLPQEAVGSVPGLQRTNNICYSFS